MQKQSQNDFPKVGTRRKCLKTAFPILGNEKNGRKQVSQSWDTKKMLGNGFPKVGKLKKWEKTVFPKLGSRKIDA